MSSKNTKGFYPLLFAVLDLAFWLFCLWVGIIAVFLGETLPWKVGGLSLALFLMIVMEKKIIKWVEKTCEISDLSTARRNEKKVNLFGGVVIAISVLGMISFPNRLGVFDWNSWTWTWGKLGWLFDWKALGNYLTYVISIIFAIRLVLKVQTPWYPDKEGNYRNVYGEIVRDKDGYIKRPPSPPPSS